ncbi:Hypothetical protein NTJ_04359 [Nesidiocoris tenuis]|uniref:VWFC domain-containing protein n=1 Tax=Nesidiocoris tenuis TaxID=355587 RepID=A0ABN7AH07_9HEMI|nr:Hypothetical protein NTJ_04359 [Nesidiocoris tenuis]
MQSTVFALAEFRLYFICIASLFNAVQGNNPSKQYYNELSCVPEAATPGRPLSYDCGFLSKLKDDKCYYKGEEYEPGQRLETIDNECVQSCSCDLLPHNKKAYWTCIHEDCPEALSPQPCNRAVPLYSSTKSCCAQDHECDHANKIKQNDVTTCEYDGKQYLIGERIYTNSNRASKEDECKICLCSQGFNGTLVEPWCRKYSCDIYLLYLSYIKGGCIPTYYHPDDCCPVPIFRCPKEADAVITPKNTIIDERNKDLTCKFGHLNLQIGQMLSSSNDTEIECVECSCFVPPLPTCVMNDECEKRRQGK